ncbi:IS66 family insertion sequence element accessory protein TnpB [Mesorhizobium sp. M1121]|uniref:IS66 family insertion sequence element accessory protein TnpB n=1 Tax=Mesorhizobium sp. M1121 TaxID=2957058 RepID=UPI00333C99FE
MILVPSGVRVWLATGHTDMRKGFPGLALVVQETLKRDPHNGHLFVFRDLLEGLTLEARNTRGDEPLRLAHFDDGDDRVILRRMPHPRRSSHSIYSSGHDHRLCGCRPKSAF